MRLSARVQCGGWGRIHLQAPVRRCEALTTAPEHVRGHLGDNREAVLEQGGWETNFTFVILFASETCVDARGFAVVYRGGADADAPQLRTEGGDGFAFVVRDDTDAIPTIASVGAPGPGLGYQGLRHSLAVEFDTWHNPRNDEPHERHARCTRWAQRRTTRTMVHGWRVSNRTRSISPTGRRTWRACDSLRTPLPTP